MANTSTEPDIRVLVGNVGDASPNKGSAKLIRNNLQQAFGAKNPVKIHVTIDKKTLEQLKAEIESALSGITIGGACGSNSESKGSHRNKKPSTSTRSARNTTPTDSQRLEFDKKYLASRRRLREKDAKEQAREINRQLKQEYEASVANTNKIAKANQSYVLKQRNKVANRIESLDAHPDSQFASESNALRTQLDDKLAEYSELQRELTTDEKNQVENLISRLSDLDRACASYYKTKDNILAKAQGDLADFDKYASGLTPEVQLDFASKIADIRTGLDSGDVDTIKKATLEMQAFKAEMKSLGYEGGGSKTPNVKFAEQQLLKLKKTWETLQASFNRSGLDPKDVGIDTLDAGVQNLITHLEQLKKSPNKVSDAVRGQIQDAVSYLTTAGRNTRQLDADPKIKPAQNAITIRQNLNELLGKALSMTEELTGAERVQIQEYLNQLTTLNSSMSSYQAKAQSDQKRTNAIIDRGKTELADFNKYVRNLTPKAQLENAGRIASIQNGLGSKDVARIEEAEHALRDFKAEMKSLGYEGGNIFTLLQSKMKQFFAYSLSAAVISGAVRSLRSVISTVKELDEALTDLRVVTGGTKDDAEELLGTYNKLAKSLGTTTASVASGATDWLRQGYNQKDTEELLTQSMTLSIVGDMESADATTALTAALKGYQLQVEEASDVVDKFFQVDMEAATSSAKLAEALAKTAANAKLAGLSLDDVIGQLAVVNEVMQESGDETGGTRLVA